MEHSCLIGRSGDRKREKDKKLIQKGRIKRIRKGKKKKNGSKKVKEKNGPDREVRSNGIFLLYWSH